MRRSHRECSRRWTSGSLSVDVTAGDPSAADSVYAADRSVGRVEARSRIRSDARIALDD